MWLTSYLRPAIGALLALAAVLGAVLVANSVWITSGATSDGPFFQPQQRFPAGDAPFSVAVADLDGDSAPDLVTANVKSNDVSVLLGNGDGSF